MLTYLIILLDDTSVSFCGYVNGKKERHLISLDALRKGIIWGMKENMNIQFVYPNYPLPKEYSELVETIDHVKIGPIGCKANLDIIIVDNLEDVKASYSYIWQCSLEDLKRKSKTIKDVICREVRLGVMLTDIHDWKQQEFDIYKEILNDIAESIVEIYTQGKELRFNLLTDRLLFKVMNNCGAGDTSITLAPNGKFYICPAFYPWQSVGSLEEGLNIPNKQLYQLDHAPICRKCDAFQCKRCIWLNDRMTGDCNTPSHQQCVASHLERNASRYLQQRLNEQGIKLKYNFEIPKIDYLDPFNIANKWK